MIMKTIIIVDDEREVLDALSEMLSLEGYSVMAYSEPNELLSSLNQSTHAVLLTDVKMPSMDGFELLGQVECRAPQVPVVLMSGHGDIPMAIEAIKQGAFDFIEKPLQVDALIRLLDSAWADCCLGLHESETNTRALKLPIESVLLGNAMAIQMIRKQILALAHTGVDTIIYGQTGCGKEVVAQCLHHYSRRFENPFVAINCGGMTESIIESELFGHEAGAFTGAQKRRIGKIEQADGGTLFLDEIESMPIAVQVKLLRVIQERKFERVGGNQLIPVDMVIIAATKEDLGVMSTEKKFRADLYYRLNVANIYLPPLNERKEDVLLLFHHFVALAARKYKATAKALSPEQHLHLIQYDWPGNVRELRNTAERFILGILDMSMERHFDDFSTDRIAEAFSFEEQVDRYEKEVLITALTEAGGNINEVCRATQLPRKTLYRKMKKYQLDKSDFKLNGS